ncbi:MAG: dihydroneopterin aldolase [Flavobacteriales bacterium]
MNEQHKRVNVIEVNGIKVHAYHGCMDEEARIGGEYEVDVALHTNFNKAAETDELDKTLDYVKVNEIVVKEMKVRSKLIEHVGNRILQELKREFAPLEKVEVRVTKINPPINGSVDNVRVILKG